MLRSLRRTVLPLTVSLLLPVLVVRPAQTQTFNVIHDFSGADGYGPYGSLSRDNAGNLYGTTSLSSSSLGTVFQLKRSHGGWLLNTLTNFTGANGAIPYSGVVFGPDGALFGTTNAGGPQGYGNVYSLRPSGTVCKTALCPWTETVLYQFAGGSDGIGPGVGNVVFDPIGNLYGTTIGGGSFGQGTVYKLTHAGGSWTESVLYSFAGGSDGAAPYGAVVLDAAGNLYGTTSQGGGSGCGGTGCGTVYELTPSGSGWGDNILYAFHNGADGAAPLGGLVFDQSGNLYGSTIGYGSGSGGTIFELSPSGGGWMLTTLYTFNYSGPVASLVMDGAGVLYGTNNAGGAYDNGSVFKLQPSNGGWNYFTLHDFTYRGSDGSLPVGGATVDAMGNVYGTTSQGGTYACGFEVDCGVVWEITP